MLPAAEQGSSVTTGRWRFVCSKEIPAAHLTTTGTARARGLILAGSGSSCCLTANLVCRCWDWHTDMQKYPSASRERLGFSPSFQGVMLYGEQKSQWDVFSAWQLVAEKDNATQMSVLYLCSQTSGLTAVPRHHRHSFPVCSMRKWYTFVADWNTTVRGNPSQMDHQNHRNTTKMYSCDVRSPWF